MRKWMIVSSKDYLAVRNISASVQSHVDYTVQTAKASVEGFNIIDVHVDPEIQDIQIKVSEYDAASNTQRIEITAKDEVNLLYAAADFESHYLPYAQATNDTNIYTQPLFTQPLKPYSYVSKPKIKHRGLWTWGHVIYNYRKYIDHMICLKMNTLIIWNDFPPINIREVISYAHDRGIEVFLGYAWGWDTKMPTDISNWEQIAEDVIQTHQTQYADIPCDGIYFQTFTEHSNEIMNGLVVAEMAVKLVNKVSRRLLEGNSNLQLLFGLHATSVKKHLDAFKELDPRVSIIWEDVGSFPYHYLPSCIEGFDEARAYNRKLQDLRKGGFGAVLKSVICLNWKAFQHQDGPFYIGEAKEADTKISDFTREKLRWVQAYWIRNAGYARELIHDFRENAMITALVEDGYFEDVINYPTALYGEMLWDPDRSTEDILLETALRPDVTFF